MKEQTIYSYKLLYRFRWRLSGVLLQVFSWLAILYGFSLVFSVGMGNLITASTGLVFLPPIHLMLFRIYAYCHAESPRLSADHLFSPWWGANLQYPASLSFYRGAEVTVCAGSILIAAALFPWVPLSYGIVLISGAIALILPRLVLLVISYRRFSRCQVRYEGGSVVFLSTDG